ncbi:hypothetical protein [Anaerovorax sp. IOR16]|nr:hypothetical protein [Anaerovorax sp. IOR16]
MMNRYYPLIDKLIYIKDHYSMSMSDVEAINEACNALSREGEKDAQNED